MKKLVLAVMLLAFSVGVNAACDVKSLKGDYGIMASGTNGNRMCAAVGTVSFDGKGTSKFALVEACDSQTAVSVTENPKYNVLSNCVGGATFSDGAQVVFVFDKQFKTAQMMAVGFGSGIGVGSMLKQ